MPPHGARQVRLVLGPGTLTALLLGRYRVPVREERAFLFLDDMAPHWRLHAPRHGFPHAANSYQVINLGWWSAVDMPAHFAHPVTAGGYCTALTQDGPPVIFAGPTLSAFAEACLSRSPDYRLHGHINDGRIAVYTR